MRRRSDRGSATLEAGLLCVGMAAGLIVVLSLTGDEVLAMFQAWFDAVGESLGGLNG